MLNRLFKRSRDASDELLIRRAQAGEREAFDALAGKYRDKILGVTRSFAPSHDDAEDAVNQALLQMWQNIGTLRASGAFFGWACEIASHCVLSEIRKQARRQKIAPTTAIEELEEETSTKQDDTAGSILLRAAGDAIRATLKDKEKILFDCHYVNQMTLDETAQIMGISPANARKIHERMKKNEQLRKILAELSHSEAVVTSHSRNETNTPQ